MEIKVKKEIEETVNLELPAFFKNPKEQEYIGIPNEQQFIKFSQGKTSASYVTTSLEWWKRELSEWVRTWNPISEEDFLLIHEDFLRLQSLKPVLAEHDPDDLNGTL